MSGVGVPFKILCFHGYRQSGESFKQKTGSLRKLLKKKAELHYLTAPLEVPSLENSEDGGRGWWFSRQDDYFNAKHKSDYVKGFDESLKCVEEFIHKNGPFHGFLGFSQGAAFVAILCHLLEQGALPYSFKFAIIVAGFISQSSLHDVYYVGNVSLPTLHVIGETDQVIGKTMSVDLLKHFKDPMILDHPGGHFVPASSPQKPIYLKFLDNIRKDDVS